MRLWVGGYTADRDGVAEGVGMLLAGAADDALAGGPLGFAGTVAVLDSPSWLAVHPNGEVLYAALEGLGAVQALRRTGEASFVRLGAPVAAGERVCHVVVAPDGGSLVASCAGDGRVVRCGLDSAGRPAAPSIAPAAEDPYASGAPAPAGALPDLDLAAAARALREAVGAEYAHLVPDIPAPRNGDGVDDTDADAMDADGGRGETPVRASRAHQSAFLPGGLIATTDAGFDLVRFWRPSARGLTPLSQVMLPRGSGPTHLRYHPSGHLYVVTELSCELFAFAPDAAGTWRIVAGSRLSPVTDPERDLAAGISLSRDAELVYATIRGSDAIAAVRVLDDGSRFEPVALVESGVEGPGHHVVERDTMLVAGQRSNEVVSLGLDLRTGIPGRVRHRAPVPSPTMLLADRRG